ncbi:MAG: hypothetical protein RLY57_566 [Candidatus Parcubacteria bacterium]|jgi:hypothetical protein
MAKSTILVFAANTIIGDYLRERNNKKTFCVKEMHCRGPEDFTAAVTEFQKLKQTGKLGAVVVSAFLTMQSTPEGVDLIRAIGQKNIIDQVPMIATCTNDEALRKASEAGCSHTHQYTDWRSPIGLVDVIHKALGIS